MKAFLRQIFKQLAKLFDFDIDFSWMGDWSGSAGFFEVLLWSVGVFCWTVTALVIIAVIKMIIDEVIKPVEGVDGDDACCDL